MTRAAARRHRARRLAVVAAVTVLAVSACDGTSSSPAGSASSAATTAASWTGTAAADAEIRRTVAEHNLGAVIVQVARRGKPLMTRAYGQSLPGVPATTDMHFRNGAVAISYVSTLLLKLVDQHRVSLDDPVSTWLPTLRNSSRVTLRMLAQMTAGYADYQLSPSITAQLYANPFRQYSPSDQVDLSLTKPQKFVPGSNWDYSHADYVILGLALEKITHRPLDVVLRQEVLDPLGLRQTANSFTPDIPSPVLHAFTSERRSALGIASGTRFLEESTYWNPSWTLARGAIQTTDIADLTRTAVAVGEGRLLTPASLAAQLDPHLGFGHPQGGCKECRPMTRLYGYGLGVVRSGTWVLQDPLFSGYEAVEAYNLADGMSISLATTFREGSFDPQGGIKNWALRLFAVLGAITSPTSPPPTGP